MKYPRPAYGDKDVPTVKTSVLYGSGFVDIPVIDTPVTPLENFKRVAARTEPYWVPNALTDFQNMMTLDPVANQVRGRQMHTDFRRGAKEDYVFIDWFNTSWTWVCSAGGAMLTPGTQLLDDITRWESVVEWPDLSEWDFDTNAKKFLQNEYDPSKALHYDIGRGCTERLVAVLGGYSEAMLALAVEPEAVNDFLNRFADHEIALFDTLLERYPLNMVTYHDDWGTERDTFFSEKMLEEIIYAPTKRIIDHIRAKGVAFEFHSCGNVKRFMPYYAALKADFLQIQRRALDIPALKAEYGDKLGFNSGFEGLVPGKHYAPDELRQMARRTVDLYGKSGGFYTSVNVTEPEALWTALTELYAYSREVYDIAYNRG